MFTVYQVENSVGIIQNNPNNIPVYRSSPSSPSSCLFSVSTLFVLLGQQNLLFAIWGPDCRSFDARSFPGQQQMLFAAALTTLTFDLSRTISRTNNNTYLPPRLGSDLICWVSHRATALFFPPGAGKVLRQRPRVKFWRTRKAQRRYL